MKTKELIKELSKINPELDVICCGEDGKTILLKIESIETVDAEKLRDSNGKPQLKFGASDSSQKQAIILVTDDF